MSQFDFIRLFITLRYFKWHGQKRAKGMESEEMKFQLVALQKVVGKKGCKGWPPMVNM